MAQSDPYDADEPAERSGIGRFFSGAILGLLVCVLVAIGLTLSFPLPEDLPGVGTVRVEGSGAPEAPVEDGDGDQEQAAMQSGSDDTAVSGEPEGSDAASGQQEPDASVADDRDATDDQVSTTVAGEVPSEGQPDDAGTEADAITDQGSQTGEVAEVTPAEPAGDAADLPAREITLAGPAIEVNRPAERNAMLCQTSRSSAPTFNNS